MDVVELLHSYADEALESLAPRYVLQNQRKVVVAATDSGLELRVNPNSTLSATELGIVDSVLRGFGAYGCGVTLVLRVADACLSTMEVNDFDMGQWGFNRSLDAACWVKMY